MNRKLSLLTICASIGAAALTNVLMARATPGGATKQKLSFAGTLRQNGQPLSGTLTFTFTKGGSPVPCVPAAMATAAPDPAGAFTTEIDISGCPTDMFDGSDVTFNVSLNGTSLTGEVPVSPVPYAKYADAVAPNPDCPGGYTKDPGPAAPFLPASIVCQKGADEVVKVGTGASAFWIDRYEASVWDGPVAGTQKFAGVDDSGPSTFSKNGQVVTPYYARSVPGVVAATRITWFQAVEVCAASGKRLPNGEEWLRAARGTADPTTENDGTAAGNNRCNTKASGPRNTGHGLGATQVTSCVSDWGHRI